MDDEAVLRQAKPPILLATSPSRHVSKLVLYPMAFLIRLTVRVSSTAHTVPQQLINLRREAILLGASLTSRSTCDGQHTALRPSAER